MTKRRFWTTGEVERVRQLAHKPAWEIGNEIGRSQYAVRTLAAKENIPLCAKRGGCWPDATVRRVHKLRKAGMSLTQIQQATGVPLGTVRQWVYGITRQNVA